MRDGWSDPRVNRPGTRPPCRIRRSAEEGNGIRDRARKPGRAYFPRRRGRREPSASHSGVAHTLAQRMPSETMTEAGPIAGAETIDMQEGNRNGLLLLHGFGHPALPLGLLAESLHAAGHGVVAPLLPGHGESVQSVMDSRREEWLACGRELHAPLCASHESVAIGDLSMGGASAAI